MNWKIHGIPRQVVKNTSLSVGARLTYVILRGYIGKVKKNPFPSQQAIAQELGCSRKTAYRWIKELEKHGYLEHKQQKFKGGKYGSNKYTIHDSPCVTDDPAVCHQCPSVTEEPCVTHDTRRKNHYIRNSHSKKEPDRLSAQTIALLADIRAQIKGSINNQSTNTVQEDPCLFNNQLIEELTMNGHVSPMTHG